MTNDTRYDAIVIGGGHNGLVNAAYLAKSGLKTLVLEQRSMVGGLRLPKELIPGFSNLVEHREIVTPLDIERVVGLSEGNIFAGELFSPQMFLNRPAPGWNQYRTPIAGYYQCGSGTHPGGCVMGGPGKLAAKQILKDRATMNAPTR